MHILIFLDQHPQSLGGAQTSVNLQRKYLERLGHKVTVVAPSGAHDDKTDESVICLPSLPQTLNREYTMVLNIKGCGEILDKKIKSMPQIDVVHVQGDLCGAILGIGFARRHNYPLVTTTHSNMEVGSIESFGVTLTKIGMFLYTRALLKHIGESKRLANTSAWNYIGIATRNADLALAPSGHFAKLLKSNGVNTPLSIMRNGVDDDRIDEVLPEIESLRTPGPEVRLIWAGRMLPEKRLMQFVEAYKLSGVDAIVDLYGWGPDEKKAKAWLADNNLSDRFVFHGVAPHSEMLRNYAKADALVQTSWGFETQGMTVFEAGAVGTPSIITDKNIADELPAGSCWVTESASVEDLAVALKRAVADIKDGDKRGKALQGDESLRQSALTRKTVKLYEDVIANHWSRPTR